MAVVIEEEVAFEGGPEGGEAVDAFEFFAFWVEGGDFEDVFEEGYAGGGCGGHIVMFCCCIFGCCVLLYLYCLSSWCLCWCT